MGKTLSLRVTIDNTNIVEPAIFANATDGTLLAAIGNDNIVNPPLTVPGRANSGATYKEIEPSISSATLPEEVELTFDSSIMQYIIYGDSCTYDEASGTYIIKNEKSYEVDTSYDDATGIFTNIYPPLTGKCGYIAAGDRRSSDTVYIFTSEIDDNTKKFKARKYTVEETAIEEASLSETDGDSGKTYYFRGNVKNNYVTYSNMCWRIVRVMEDGDIKLVLADESAPCGNETMDNIIGNISFLHKDSSTVWGWHIFSNNNNYIFKDTNASATLNAWAGISSDRTYIMQDIWEGMEVTQEFTNNGLDLTKLSTTPNWCIDAGLTSGTRLRKLYSSVPTLKCNMTGAITDNNSQVALLSIDEVMFLGRTAGYTFDYYNNSNHNLASNNYLSSYPSFYTLSPVDPIMGSGNQPWIIVSGGKEIWDASVLGFDTWLLPSVVLKSDVTITAGSDGTLENPYVVS